MKSPARGPGVVLLAAALCLALGCGKQKEKLTPRSFSGPKKEKKEEKDPKFEELKDLGVALIDYAIKHKKGAAGTEDLAPLLKGNPKLLDRLRSGDIVVVWGVSPAELGKEPSGYVVAYEKQTPTKGGYVLLGDAYVKKVTAAEFKKLELAEPKKK